jgi:hypothetical protein
MGYRLHSRGEHGGNQSADPKVNAFRPIPQFTGNQKGNREFFVFAQDSSPWRVVLNPAPRRGDSPEARVAVLLYIAAAVVGLFALLFMFGAAKVASDSDRQSETLWRLIAPRRFPSDNS